VSVGHKLTFVNYKLFLFFLKTELMVLLAMWLSFITYSL